MWLRLGGSFFGFSQSGSPQRLVIRSDLAEFVCRMPQPSSFRRTRDRNLALLRHRNNHGLTPNTEFGVASGTLYCLSDWLVWGLCDMEVKGNHLLYSDSNFISPKYRIPRQSIQEKTNMYVSSLILFRSFRNASLTTNTTR